MANWKPLNDFLSTEMKERLQQENLKVEDFIRYNDFGGAVIRQTKKATELYRQITKENKIRIWK